MQSRERWLPGRGRVIMRVSMKAGGRLVWTQEPQSLQGWSGREDKPSRKRATEETVLSESQLPTRARREMEHREKVLRT